MATYTYYRYMHCLYHLTFTLRAEAGAESWVAETWAVVAATAGNGGRAQSFKTTDRKCETTVVNAMTHHQHAPNLW